MYKVLLPTECFHNEDSLKKVSLLFNTIYNSKSDIKIFNGYCQLVIDVDPSKGKQIAIDYAKALGQDYCYFIKNNYLFKKWTDTGIVDKLGQVTETNLEIKLKDV